MAGTAVYKRDHTTRMTGRAYVEDNGADVAMDLSSKTIEVKLYVSASGAVVTLAIGTGVTLGGEIGLYYYDVTVGNLATLGDPEQIITTINIWNADNTLAATATSPVNVSL